MKAISRHRRLAILVLALSGLIALGASGASATHGSWTHHHLIVFENGPSQYGSYANVGAQNNMSMGWARWEQRFTSGSLIAYEEVSCWGNCAPRKTLTRYIPQASYLLRSLACAEKGTHQLPGTVLPPTSPCNIIVSTLHEHRVPVS